MTHDIDQLRQQLAQQRAVAGRLEVSIERMEEPQRCICGIVDPFALVLRKQVGDQAVPDVLGEIAQDAPRFGVPARHQCQPFQADHRVAPPIREPVITGNDGAVRIVARRSGLRLLAGRLDDETVGSDHQFIRRRLAQARVRRFEQGAPSGHFFCHDFAGEKRRGRLPTLGRSGQHRLVPRNQSDVERTRRP